MSRFASETHQFETEKINPFIPILDNLPGEYWEAITDAAAPGVLPYYAISNYGRVVHIFKKIYMSTSYDGPGYRIVLLRTIYGTKTFRIHRLMMLTFRYNPNYSELEVDHVTGNKQANYLDFPVMNPKTNSYELQDGLRWVDKPTNLQLAHNDQEQLKNNLIGKKHGNSTIDEAKVREICQYLEEGNLSFAKIAEVTNTSLGIVQNIQSGKSWFKISSQYNIPLKTDSRQVNISEEKVKNICFELANKTPMPNICKKLDVHISVVKSIKYRVRYIDISKDYKF